MEVGHGIEEHLKDSITLDLPSLDTHSQLMKERLPTATIPLTSLYSQDMF